VLNPNAKVGIFILAAAALAAPAGAGGKGAGAAAAGAATAVATSAIVPATMFSSDLAGSPPIALLAGAAPAAGCSPCMAATGAGSKDVSASSSAMEYDSTPVGTAGAYLGAPERLKTGTPRGVLSFSAAWAAFSAADLRSLLGDLAPAANGGACLAAASPLGDLKASPKPLGEVIEMPEKPLGAPAVEATAGAAASTAASTTAFAASAVADAHAARPPHPAVAREDTAAIGCWLSAAASRVEAAGGAVILRCRPCCVVFVADADDEVLSLVTVMLSPSLDGPSCSFGTPAGLFCSVAAA